FTRRDRWLPNGASRAYSFAELTAAVVPLHLVVPDTYALIQQHSRFRHCDRSVVGSGGEGNAFGDRKHLAHDLSPHRVEGLGHQRVLSDKQQTASGKDYAGLVGQYALVLFAIQRAPIDAILFYRYASDQIKKMAAVRQKHGKAGYTVSGDPARGGNATGSRYSLNCSKSTGGKHDHVIAIPRSSATVERGAQRLHRTAASGDLLNPVLREESDVMAVGRPEWVRGVLGSQHRLSLKCVHGPQPELTLTIHYRRDCDVTTIRGNREAVNPAGIFR